MDRNTNRQGRATCLPNRHIILAMMTLVSVINFLDRQILGILLPQIKAEFHLSNTQLGLLAGPTFAVIYIVLGVPLGLLADRGNRRNIVAASLVFFSVTTCLCGMASSFAQLLWARFGTGVGEAGTAPAINALISDLYPPHQRGGALSVYSAGSNIGLLIALVGGSWIAEAAGWRMAFLAATLPGLLVAILFLLTVREPARAPARPPSLWEIVTLVGSQRSVRFTAAGAALASISSYGALTFVPLFLMRSHHMTLTAIGMTLALLTGIVGWAGTALPGLLAERYSKGDGRAGLYVSAYGILCSLPFIPVFYLANNLDVALAAMVPPVFVSAIFVGPSLAVIQNVVPPRMRAQGAALLMLVSTLVGMGLGPQMIGFFSDILRPLLGENALRYALMSVVIPSAIGAWCFWRAASMLRADMPQ